MKRHLFEYSLGLLQKTVFVLEGDMTIGRSSLSTVSLDEPEISRTHAKVVWSGERWVIHDLQSRNGTFVNDRRIQVHALSHGDQVRIGPVVLRFLEVQEEETPDSRLRETGEGFPETRREIHDQMDLVNAFLDVLPIGVAVLNQRMEVRYFNRALNPLALRTGGGDSRSPLGPLLGCAMCGQEETSCGQTLRFKGCPLRTPIHDAFREGRATIGREAPWTLKADPQPRFIRFSLVPLPYSLTGEPLALLTWEDLTDRKEAERALKESAMLSAVMDGHPLPTFVIDHDHRVILWNRAAESLTRVPRERVLGKPVDPDQLGGCQLGRSSLADAVLDLERTSAEHPLADSPVSPNALIPEALETAQQVAVAGVRRHLSFHAARLRDASGRILGAIETVQDNTERERIQQMLQHSQKMQALGTLAGGMAHEFNNILAATQGYAQLLGVHLKNQPDLGEYVREIEEGCTRAAGLVRRILTFSRMETRTGSLLDVNPVVADVVRILQEMFPPAIRLVADLQADLPLVMAEPIEMEQLLIHLGMNARDALHDGGEVRFSTRLFIPDDPFCRHQPWARSGRFLELVVEDTGTGIPAQVLPRIFDPFFTTKGPGRGTGLGLSIAHAIVHDHGGQILAESPVDERTGGGSRLRVFLPLAEKTGPTGWSRDPAQESEPSPAAGSPSYTAGGT